MSFFFKIYVLTHNHIHHYCKCSNLSLLAENCDEANYVRLVEALCRENQIPVLKIGDNKTLGEWAGLCKIDREGNARKERLKILCFRHNFLH